MNQQSFLGYLQGKHAEQYTGTDDLMPDDFEDWLEAQDPLDLIEYAEMWHKLLVNANTPK